MSVADGYWNSKQRKLHLNYYVWLLLAAVNLNELCVLNYLIKVNYKYFALESI